MNALFQPYTFTSADLTWITMVGFVIAFCAFVLALLHRISQLDHTGWEEEAGQEEWRQYQLDPGDRDMIPRRVMKQVLREYLSTWYGALHGLLLVLSGIPAIALSVLSHLRT